MAANTQIHALQTINSKETKWKTNLQTKHIQSHYSSAVLCAVLFQICSFGLEYNYLIDDLKNMVDLIILSLVKYSDGNILIWQLRFVNNGDLNGYTKAMIITMTVIIIVLQLGVCKFRMAPNVLRIYEVRLNEILNYKQMIVGVSCIYAVIGRTDFINKTYHENTRKI